MVCHCTKVTDVDVGADELPADLLHRRHSVCSWCRVYQGCVSAVLPQAVPVTDRSLGGLPATCHHNDTGYRIYLPFHLSMQPYILCVDAVGWKRAWEVPEFRPGCSVTRWNEHPVGFFDLRLAGHSALELESFPEEEVSSHINVRRGVLVSPPRTLSVTRSGAYSSA